MADVGQAVLQTLLDRLLAGLLNGPGLNCRPHASRQRLDVNSLEKLRDIEPTAILTDLLSPERKVKIVARVAAPTRTPENRSGVGSGPLEMRSSEETVDPAQREWIDQQAVFTKIRNIVEDAKTYEQDTGVHILSIGFPLLSIPAGGIGGGSRRRILAPIAFIPIEVTVTRGAQPSISLECHGSGADLITPNDALHAWLEQQQKAQPEEFFADIEGEQPWREIAGLVRHVAIALGVQVPRMYASADSENWQPDLSDFKLQASPRSENESAPTILNSAVLGLYPMTNQGLIRDAKALVAGEPLVDPARSFVKVGLGLGGAAEETSATYDHGQSRTGKMPKRFHDERLVSIADPCQAKAVRLARTCRGLVIHGPPGTGKSQTITNVIGDHLARGERVLVVCDKRTALDVVYHRLNHLGLASLCAVVHDPQRDQRNFYKSVRAQIDELVDAKSNSEADRSLQRADDELSRLHAELTGHRDALMEQPIDGESSVHDLIGSWLGLPESPVPLDTGMNAISPSHLNDLAVPLGELFKRSSHVEYPKNPWTAVVGVSLQQFLKLPVPALRQTMNEAAAAAKNADATLDKSIPPFAANIDVIEQGSAREKLGDVIRSATELAAIGIREYWAKQDARTVLGAHQKIADAEPMLDRLRLKRLDTELAIAARSNVPTISTVAQQLAAIDAYLGVARTWHAVFHSKLKKAATQILIYYGLNLSPAAADRLKTFLQELRERLVLSQIYCDITSQSPAIQLIADEQLDHLMGQHAQVLDLLLHVDSTPALTPIRSDVRKALTNSDDANNLLTGLRKSPTRAKAIADVLTPSTAAGALSGEVLSHIGRALFTGKRVGPAISALAESVNSIEDVIRVREAIAQLPAGLRPAVKKLIDIGADAEAAMPVLQKAVLAGEISRRLDAAPELQAMDAHHIKEVFERYSQLTRSKRSLVRDSILHRWTRLQRERLLASTGTRLKSLGAEVKRRFMLTGEKAMRLRKVIELGRKAEGGDALFDLRPVWMASPETVAQIFPRQPVFDVVIFDEASQCRLEEALPVLIRAKRVVVAGDQKQLPPSRFFESAAISSDEKEAETDQELFEVQQGDTEDLLSASLNMEIQESYLDVHYRSRNADLIEFSNQSFYGSRLQAIPGHPKNRARFAPLTLNHVGGVYNRGANPAEADRVCQIVRDLLKRSNPPSIGIACFNVIQRDLILEKLDDLIAADSEFAVRFAAARTRVGQGSFEGLFVKNLENVQGDERDHIIISTTYGPDAGGKFYRRFGPLGRAGGGRRLNVLVTRARDEVHLVTSIPHEAYRSLPPIPTGTAPTGAWLLFSYLQFAESLAGAYEQSHRILEQAGAAGSAIADVRDPKTASPFAASFAKRLAHVHKVGSTVNWGNPGFCIDIALQHPARAEDVTLGILCDGSRFANAEDLVEWDLFRTEVHESQGWNLQRVWTPHYFRDPTGTEERLSDAINTFLSSEVPPDELPVTPES